MREQSEEERTEQEAGEENAGNQLGRLKEKLKERLKTEEEDPRFNRATQIRTAIALAALAGMLLPWLRLDGYAETMSAADLLSYALTNPERETIFGVSKLGTLAVLFTPPIVFAAVVYGFFRTIIGRRSLSAYLIGATLPIGMLMLSGSIVSSDGWDIAGTTVPGFGLMVTVSAQGALFINTLMEGDY